MRTAVCPVCGAKRLKWGSNALGMRYLVEFDSGVEHYRHCPGVPPSAQEPEPKTSGAGAQEPSPSSDPFAGMDPGMGQSSTQGAGEPEPGTEPGQSSAGAQGAGEPSSTEPEPTEPEPGTEPGAEPEPEPTEPEPEPVKPLTAPIGSGTDHMMLARLIRYAQARRNILTVGPAGGGKTTGAGMVAERLGLNYHESSMGPQTSQWDLVGFIGPTGTYNPGIAYAPFKCGGVLMLDEMDAANPAVLIVLNSLMANGHYTFPNGERVTKHADFVLIAGANTYGRGADRLYVGRSQLDAATLDRFAVIEWDYDERAELLWAGRDMVDWVRYVQRIRKRAQELKMRFVVSPRASINGAVLLRAGEPRAEVAESVLWKGLATDQRAELERTTAGAGSR